MMSNPASNDQMRTRRRRILFVAEAVTLAHLARPLTLARALDPNHYDVHLACDTRYREFLKDLPFPVRPIRSISSEQFLARLAQGSPLFDFQTLRDYVEQDLQMIAEIDPDLIVGDLRLSLAVSTRVAGKPYIAIANAYWSPFGRQRYPLPELPFVRIVGVTLGSMIFKMLRPVAFAYHTFPVNRLRRKYGLPSLGFDLRRIYTDADTTLYADIPELAPTFDLPANHHYIGPIAWSPPVKLPDWWDRVPNDRSAIYVTLGSSGRSNLLPTVLQSLEQLPVCLLVATAGRIELRDVPGNALVADYLPGDQAARRARLVICNGGSPTTQQALTAGTPVLAIASNMDQHLNMEAIARTGAGELLRAEHADPARIRGLVTRLHGDGTYAEAATRLAGIISQYDATARFQAIVGRALNNGTVCVENE